ncbi:MAG: ABC transporter substrate-binding protein, partial [Bacteroidota bacterium]
AFYFHALADFNLKKYDDAEKTLLDLFGKFPKWENGDEALYLLANIAFERKEDNIALSYTSKMRQSSVQVAADQMKGYYLSKRSIAALKNLQSVYPKDEFIAQLLVDKIAAESVTIEDVRFGEALARIYKLQAPTRTRVKIAALPEKDTIFVGVVLPFNLSKVRAQNKPPLTQMSVEMYQAMRVAKRDLDTTGVKVKLVAYDIKDNPDTLKFMAKQGEFDNIDLFVGPIFEKDYEAMLKVAKEKNIYVINPILNNEQYQNHQQAFLLTPTLQTQGKQTAYFAKKQWAAQKAIIFHSDLPDDVTLAKAHQEEAKKQGIEIMAMQQITTSKLNQIEEVLTAH